MSGPVYRRASRADPEEGRPANWCHFWMEAGQATMEADAKCPGGD